MGILLVDNPLIPTMFVATTVQFVVGCAMLVEVSNVQFRLVPPAQIKFKFEPERAILISFAGEGGSEKVKLLNTAVFPSTFDTVTATWPATSDGVVTMSCIWLLEKLAGMGAPAPNRTVAPV